MNNRLYERVTTDIIDQLKRGTVPWIKPWRSAEPFGGLPYNAESGRHYNGINILSLWACSKPYAVNAWLTYKQAAKAGGYVRAGEKGTPVFYVGEYVKEENCETGETEARRIKFLKGYYVFNVAQCEGLPTRYFPAPMPEQPQRERLEAAERFLGAARATVHHGGSRACYVPSRDEIHLPEPRSFETIAHYYATSLHEHSHWTGAEHRLNRAFGKRFADQAYAAEELVAELSSAFLCAQLGIEGRLRHAEYIAHWIALLTEHKSALLTAAAKATAAANYLTELSRCDDKPATIAA